MAGSMRANRRRSMRAPESARQLGQALLRETDLPLVDAQFLVRLELGDEACQQILLGRRLHCLHRELVLCEEAAIVRDVSMRTHEVDAGRDDAYRRLVAPAGAVVVFDGIAENEDPLQPAELLDLVRASLDADVPEEAIRRPRPAARGSWSPGTTQSPPTRRRPQVIRGECLPPTKNSQ